MTLPNAAILIAVSDYSTQTKLPACRHDAALVKSILERTGKFLPANILVLDGVTTSTHIKAELARFITTLGTSGIGELVFYYSGHGTFDGEFFFLPSDYDSRRHNTTALSNTELDELLRGVKPEITVKIVDACQSGQEYIKGQDELEKRIGETKPKFQTCYFMFSSNQDQSSWQDDKLSDFTREFATAIASHSEPTIRYKDIIDALTDAFSNNARQQPFYVIQAKYTELFSNLTDDFREAIRKLLPTGGKPQNGSLPLSTTGAPPEKQPLLIKLKEAVTKESQLYCTEEEAIKVYQAIEVTLRSRKPTEPLDDFYKAKVTQNSNNLPMPNERKIAEWLAASSPHNYFVSLSKISEKYRVPADLLGALSMANLFKPQEMVERERWVIGNFKSTIEKAPYKGLTIALVPTLENLPWWCIWIAAVNSKTHLRLFHSYAQLKEFNWSQRQPPEDIEWRTVEVPLKDMAVVLKEVESIVTGYDGDIIDQLAGRYGLTESKDKQQ